MNLDQFELEYPTHHSSQQKEEASGLLSSQTGGFPPSSLPEGIPSSSYPDLVATSQLSSSQLERIGKPARATVSQKLEALDWYHSHGSSQKRTVSHFTQKGTFGITRSSFNRWINDEDRIREAYDKLGTDSRCTFKTVHERKNGEVDKCLEMWYEQKLFANQHVTERDLIQKWFTFDKLYNPSQSDAVKKEVKSNGWVYHFKSRLQHKRSNVETFQRSMASTTKLQEITHLRKLLEHEPSNSVFFMDEFMLTNTVVPQDGPRDVFTVGVCSNADGTEVWDPLIVSPSKIEGCYHSGIGFTTEIFWEYIKRIDSSLNGRKVTLLLDSLHQHVVAQNLTNIKVIWVRFSANLFTNIIRWFKLEFKIMLLKFKILFWMTTGTDHSLKGEDFVKLVKETSSQLGDQKSLIQQCWSFSNVLCDEGQTHLYQFRDQEVKFARLLKLALDEKILTSPLLMGIDEILFPSDEEVSNTILSDQDIVARVKILNRSMNESNPKKGSQQMYSEVGSVDETDLEDIGKLLILALKPFFDNNPEKFIKSREALKVLMNQYVKESMDLWLDVQHSTETRQSLFES